MKAAWPRQRNKIAVMLPVANKQQKQHRDQKFIKFQRIDKRKLSSRKIKIIVGLLLRRTASTNQARLH